jgi:hypothetical protein
MMGTFDRSSGIAKVASAVEVRMLWGMGKGQSLWAVLRRAYPLGGSSGIQLVRLRGKKRWPFFPTRKQQAP